MPKVTHITEAPSGAIEFTARSGKVFELKRVSMDEIMDADDLAVDEETGKLRVMRIPYLRALVSVVKVDGKPFGPIRTEIDRKKWSRMLSGSDAEDLVDQYNKINEVKSAAELKNE